MITIESLVEQGANVKLEVSPADLKMFAESIFIRFFVYKVIKEEYYNQSKRFTSSFFISSSILRYRAKARLPSECPDMEAIRFGSLTCL